MSDAEKGVIAYAVWVCVLIGVLWLCKGCYAQHEAAPCDAGLYVDSSMVERRIPNPEDAGSSPARRPNGWCEGPYVGCIAPGSPVSSTWRGK